MSKTDHELEVKLYIQDRAALEQRLLDLGAEQVRGRTHELNLRFDTPRDQLKRNKQLLRLRQDHAAHLTFKGPSKMKDGAVSRQEIEVEVSDFEVGRRLIEALGFRVVVIYEKYRATFTLDELEITVDELPMGDFVEIEGEDQQQIRSCAERLGLDWKAAIDNNYIGLFEVARRRMKFDFRDLTFENFEGLAVTPEQMGVRPADGG
jgi:adenylate cyclase class 2